jgi:hypothetical protein
MSESVQAAAVALLPGDTPSIVAVRAEVERVARFLLREPTDDALQMRLGGWQLDGRRSAVQAAATAAVLAIAAQQTGLDSVPVALLALVLPFLVDIERVELRPSETIVLAALSSRAPAGEDAATWYAALPADLRDQITELEFADLLQRLNAAGAIIARDDGTYGFPDTPYGFVRLVHPPSETPRLPPPMG